MAELTPEVIEHALATARRLGVDEVRLKVGDTVFQAELSPISVAKPISVPVEEAPVTARLAPLKATLVGYYSDESASLQVGQSVKKGDIVGTITALGIGTDVESNVTGEVVEVLVQGGEPVQFGQPLAMVKLS